MKKKGKGAGGRPPKAKENVILPPNQTLMTSFLASQPRTSHTERDESEESEHDPWREAVLDSLSGTSDSELDLRGGRESEQRMSIDHRPIHAHTPESPAHGAANGGSTGGDGAEASAQRLGADAQGAAHAQGQHEQRLADHLRRLLDAPDEDRAPSDGEEDGEEEEGSEEEVAPDSPQMGFVKSVKAQLDASKKKYTDLNGKQVELFSLIREEGKIRFEPPDPCASMLEPDGSGFCLQAVNVWDPESLGGVLRCPYCTSTRLESLGWTRARRMLCLDRVESLLTRRFKCLDCETSRRQHQKDETEDADTPDVCACPFPRLQCSLVVLCSIGFFPCSRAHTSVHRDMARNRMGIRASHVRSLPILSPHVCCSRTRSICGTHSSWRCNRSMCRSCSRPCSPTARPLTASFSSSCASWHWTASSSRLSGTCFARCRACASPAVRYSLSAYFCA